jgi:hypothetical protein
VQDRHHQVESGAILRAEERKKTTTTNKQKSQREGKKAREILPELWKLALLV